MKDGLTRKQKKARRNTRAAVRRGAALLDRAMPTWYQKLDLEVLDLSSCQFCVCGQLAKFSTPARAIIKQKEAASSYATIYGSWNFHAMIEALESRFVEAREASYDDLGFDTSSELDEAEGYIDEAAYEVLGGMWVREVRARQRAQAAA